MYILLKRFCLAVLLNILDMFESLSLFLTPVELQ